MWKKFKESKFAQKCKELSGKGGFVASVVCIALIVAVVLSVSIATNRAKKKYGFDDVTTGTLSNGGNQTEGADTIGNTGNSGNTENAGNAGNVTEDGTVNAPVHGDQTETPVGNEPEEFKLELPTVGVIAKGHDATIQVWNETLGAYKVHLGLDIASADHAPVLAAADGTVTKVWDDALMGKCVAIHHGDEIYTFYKNLDPILASGITENAEVKCGQQIGNVGSSAISELADEPHLHLEMTVNGIAVDPQDYLSDKAKETIASASDAYEENANQ